MRRIPYNAQTGKNRAVARLFGMGSSLRVEQRTHFGRLGQTLAEDRGEMDVPVSTVDTTRMVRQATVAEPVFTALAPASTTIGVEVTGAESGPVVQLAPADTSTRATASEIFTERKAQTDEALAAERAALSTAAAGEARARRLEDEARRQASFENGQRLLQEAANAKTDAQVAKRDAEVARQKRAEVGAKPAEELLADAKTRSTKKYVMWGGAALLIKLLLF